ncbi:TIGR03808 family TAT-translocated repetitive protein [Chthonobacter rhizosphaerae]|uniref:TIGR03808 family TAT-translocated repetitive protein n=1 Tax=Chthonobacter rhizosphaerae TaxID=2735553 RepID=UPI0015EEE26B|nr:TIGR03808 family TAT-translocated repetitive protein [Chthonobacter rhizosphaerae]
MDRRSFLFGTAAAGAALAAAPARADTVPARIRLADLRGSFLEADSALRPGAVDDQSAVLQAAIDRAVRDDRPLFLAPGRYQVSNITLPDGLTLVGVPGRTRLVYGGGGHLIEAVHARGVGLDGIVLDGANRPLGDYATGLVQFTDVADVALDEVEVIGSARMGVTLERVSGRVSRCRLTGARQAGLWSVDATGLSIMDNTVSDCGDGGILVHRWEAGEDGTIVTANRVERIGAKSGGTGQNGNGINVFRAAGVIVTNNRVTDCAFSAIRSNAGSNVQITGNSCLRSGETAIYSEFGFEGAMVAHNVVDGAAIGVSIANFNEGGRLAVVTGNLIRNLRNGAPYPDEYGFNFGIGISVEADTAVTGNVIDGAPSVGILMGWGPYLRDVSATGNVIRKSRIGVAVSVVEGAGASVITDNLMSEVAEGGVRGMRWAEAVTEDLATGDMLASGLLAPHLTVRGNRVG